MVNLSNIDYNQTPPENADFLAPVNFDDLHNSIVAEPSLNHFPMPGNGGAENQPPEFPSTNPWAAVTNDENDASGRTRSGSIRRKSEVPRLVGSNLPADSARPSTSGNPRTRRSSLIQATSASSATSRAPRKSVGTGSYPSGVATRRQSLSARKASAADQQNGLLQPRGQNLDPNRTSDESKLPTNSRTIKAKSLQPPTREPRENYLSTTTAVDHTRSSSTNAVRTPMKNQLTGPAPTTPSSSNKRVSVMPHHVTGLGARTISPTDARRLQRMSAAPQVPPVPYTPPTQTDPVPVRPRSCVQSPSYIPRKSVTPSSTRTTPDPNRKSYTSGLSLTPNTANSARNLASSVQTRLSQTPSSSSRLPTPKPRVEHVVADEEEVPPVPAIPKAFESPKGEEEQPIFPTSRKSSLAVDPSRPKSKRDSDLDTNHTGDDSSERSGGSAMKTPEAKPRAPVGVSKKSLQPLKLPPLNLLPLGTPMATKIEALKDREEEGARKAHTPSAQLLPKTPSTPMTASKANFFQARDEDDVGMPLTQARSSTSHFVVSSGTSGLRTASSSSALASFDSTPSANRATSPTFPTLFPRATATITTSGAMPAETILKRHPKLRN